MTYEPKLPYIEDPYTLDAQAAIEAAHKLEQTTESYDLAVAENIKALSEVSHALKTITKKHTTHLKQFSEVNL